MPQTPSRSLEQAASIVFVLVAILPLLIATWTLYSLNAIHSLQAQASLGLALTIALLGFYIFRLMMAEISRLIQDLRRVIEQEAARTRAAKGARPEATGAEAPTARGVVAPGIGPIREFGDIALTMARVWRQEAAPHLGRRVVVSVANSVLPIAGTLKKVTDDGVLLEHGGEQIAVSYRRMCAIDADH